MHESTDVHLSLVIPAYNEAARLPATLESVHIYLAAQPFASEVIVVDDGSSDETARDARNTAAAFYDLDKVQHRCIQLDQNRGKGAAVRRGIYQEAKGTYRFFFDADASTPVEELGPALALLEDGFDVVIGSRALAASNVELHQRWYRELMGKVNNLLLKALRLTPFKDTQCGFKGFTAEAAKVIFPRQTIAGFAFDVELLFIAGLHGLTIAELPITWRNSPRSTLNPVSDSIAMILEALSVRVKAIRGSYR